MKGLVEDKYLVKISDVDTDGDFYHFNTHIGNNGEVTGRIKLSYNYKKCGYDYFVINNVDEGETISY